MYILSLGVALLRVMNNISREYLQLKLAGSYWQVLLAGLVAIKSLPTAQELH